MSLKIHSEFEKTCLNKSCSSRKMLLGVPGGLEVELRYCGVSGSYELSAHEAYLLSAAVLATAIVNWL